MLPDLKKSFPQLPVVVWTSHSDKITEAEFMAAGAQACIDKLQREKLLETLQSMGLNAAASTRRGP